MAYLTIKQIKDQYNIAEKTIRRLYENKTISRSQGYKNKKGKWVLNSDFIESRFADKRKDQPSEQIKTLPKTSQSSQADTDNKTLEVLSKTVELLQAQLQVKDKQIDNLTMITDQQQKLTAQLQTQLLIASPTGHKTTESIKTKPTAKKPVKRAQNSSKQQRKAKTRSHWWSRGK